MCIQCAGSVILRTSCGAERVVSTDCDQARRAGLMVPMLDRTRSYSRVTSVDSFPDAAVSQYREYRWRGDQRDGVPILDEVLSNQRPVIRWSITDAAPTAPHELVAPVNEDA